MTATPSVACPAAAATAPDDPSDPVNAASTAFARYGASPTPVIATRQNPIDPSGARITTAAALNEQRTAINTLQNTMVEKISMPAGAATGDLLRWSGIEWETTETRFLEGNGAPNGVVSAPLGSRYIDKLATLGQVEWVKATGGGGNTGWIVLAGDSGWIGVGNAGAPAFQNGWANYGGSWSKAGYRKLNGIVHLEGLVLRAGSMAANIFTLPVGSRPHDDMHISTFVSIDTTPSLAAVNISVAGTITGRPTAGGYLSLDGISFPADN